MITSKPPTLREWLGDRVAELGRWADVLRDQPVPAGCVSRWEWNRDGGDWMLAGYDDRRSSVAIHLRGSDVWTYTRSSNAFRELVQMALFTRHPDVQPEPKPPAFPWDPFPEVP